MYAAMDGVRAALMADAVACARAAEDPGCTPTGSRAERNDEPSGIDARFAADRCAWVFAAAAAEAMEAAHAASAADAVDGAAGRTTGREEGL